MKLVFAIIFILLGGFLIGLTVDSFGKEGRLF